MRVQCVLLCRDSFGGWFRGGSGGFLGRGLGNNLNLQLRRHFAMQLDGHGELANRLQGLSQNDLAAIDLEALGRQIGSNIGRGDGTKQVAAVAGLAGKAQNHWFQLGHQLFRLHLF